MIEHDASPPDGSDAEISQLFGLLKNVEPALAARVEYRMTVAHELARMQPHSRNQPVAWWKRSIPIPVPLALGLCAMLIAIVGISRDFWQRIPEIVAVPTMQLDAQNAGDHLPLPSIHADRQEQRLVVHVSSTYLCGIGPLNTESRYVIQEPGQ